MKLDRDLYLTADRDEVVEDGDPRAAFLLGNAGTEIPDAEAERLGVKAAGKTADKAQPAPDDKSAPAPANKTRKRAAKKTT